jgi:hypothetical protein
MTNKSSQNAAELHAQIEALGQELERVRQERDEYNQYVNELCKDRLDGWVNSAFDQVAQSLGFETATGLQAEVEKLRQGLRQKTAECDKLRADIADILCMPFGEAVADLVHQQWSGWMEYLFSKCRFIGGITIIPKWAVKRWQRQMTTPFLELPPEEKESDLSEARKVISVFSVLPKETEHRLLTELTEERQQRIESNALLLATARALGLDAGDVDDLPQKAAAIMAEGSAACQEWDTKCELLCMERDDAVTERDNQFIEVERLRGHIKSLDLRISLEVERGDELREAHKKAQEHLDRKQALVDELRRQVDKWQVRVLEAEGKEEGNA